MCPKKRVGVEGDGMLVAQGIGGCFVVDVAVFIVDSVSVVSTSVVAVVSADVDVVGRAGAAAAAAVVSAVLSVFIFSTFIVAAVDINR